MIEKCHLQEISLMGILKVSNTDPCKIALISCNKYVVQWSNHILDVSQVSYPMPYFTLHEQIISDTTLAEHLIYLGEKIQYFSKCPCMHNVHRALQSTVHLLDIVSHD